MQKLLNSVLDGYSSAVIACGQTGSGKTYTMCGRNEVCTTTFHHLVNVSSRRYISNVYAGKEQP